MENKEQMIKSEVERLKATGFNVSPKAIAAGKSIEDFVAAKFNGMELVQRFASEFRATLSEYDGAAIGLALPRILLLSLADAGLRTPKEVKEAMERMWPVMHALIREYEGFEYRLKQALGVDDLSELCKEPEELNSDEDLLTEGDNNESNS